jgi:serine/threonine protein kinase
MLPTIINNRYRLVCLLGEGGFGKTYLVEDTHLPSRRVCVIKQLKPVTENSQIYQIIKDRFEREAAILEELGDNNNRIPKLYAYFSEEGQFYLVQEYIEGKTLAEKVANGNVLSESVVKEILKNLLFLLNFIHTKGIIHRDIKPDNIILRDSDNIPVLIDFGAVRESMGTLINSQGGPTSSIIVGTPGFMPHEQAAGRPLYNSDLYSLALTMIYLLTGKSPQDLTDPRTGEIVWHNHADNVSHHLQLILDKATKPYAGDRYSTAKEMVDVLQSINPIINPTINPSIRNTVSVQQQPIQQQSVQKQILEVPDTIVPNPSERRQYIPPPSNQSSHPSPQTPPPIYTPQVSNNFYQPQQTQQTQQNLQTSGGSFNTSMAVPQEIRGWNWGAFLLPGLWPFTNQVWIGLLCWIPYVGLIMAIILGANGNVWAWKSRQWASVESFKAHQRAWTKAALIIYSSFTLLAFLAIIIASTVPQKETNTAQENRDTTTKASKPKISKPKISTKPTFNSGSFTGRTQIVDIGNTQEYIHVNNLFSIDIPSKWKIKENKKDNEVVVVWTDKTENAFVIVDVANLQQKLNQQQLTEGLQNGLKISFAKEPEFTMEVASTNDGRVQIPWSYKVSVTGFSGRMFGYSFIEQEGDKVTIVSYALPEDQFDSLNNKLIEIVDSYQVNSDATFN